MCGDRWCFIVFSVVASLLISTSFAQNELMQQNYNPTSYQNNLQSSWLHTAREAFSGPTGQLVIHMANEFISRSAGNSQILSLNLTNLLVLVLLKALIFAAGLLGAGNWGQYGRGRSLDTPLVTQDETPLFIGYLAAEGSGQDGCLNQAACKAPETASEYLRAAKAVIKGAEMFDNNYWNTTAYPKLIYQLEQSIQEGKDGAQCDLIYYCRI